MSTMSELSIMVEEGVELVESGMTLADTMQSLQEHYEFFCDEYDMIMINIINCIPNEIYH